MSQSPQNQLETEVKINNKNSFAAPVVDDIEQVQNSFQKYPNTKSKTNIKLNPIHPPPNPIQPPPNPINFPTKDISNISPQKNKLIYHEPDERISPTPLKRKNSETSAASPLRRKLGIRKGYELANYGKTLDYRKSQSYCKKISRQTGEDYQPIDTCGSNQQLKEYGLGVYLYFQFIKRLAITLFFMSVILIFPLINNYQGNGLSKYTASQSYTMTLARFTIGNITNGSQQDYLIVTIADVISMIVLFIFYIHWRSFHKAVIEETSKDFTILNPAAYSVSIEQFHDQTTSIKTLQPELKGYFDSLYKGAFEVQVVYNYQGNFDNFIELDERIEAVQKESQIIKQTGKDSDQLAKEEKKLDQIEEQMKKDSQIFEPLYAIVHFRTLKAKLAFLNHCKRYRLQNTFGQSLQRFLCCTPLPPQHQLFLGKFPIFIRNNNLSRPEQINWRNIDLSKISILLRWVLSIVLVVVAIAVSSALIGFCTLYVASTSSCQNFIFTSSGNIQTDTQTVKLNGSTAIFCYCSDNFASIYTNSYISDLCSGIQSTVLLTNGLQIAASVLSSVTNAILGIIIGVIAKRLLRPNTIPKEYIFVFWGVLISNFINSCIIPLMLNANVYGVQFVSYLQFIDFINSKQLSIFSDFTTDWYAIISPYYTTIIIISSFISPIISVSIFAVRNCFIEWRLKSKCETQDKQNPLIQKQANNNIASLQFEFAEEHSRIMLYLLITIMYSGLIPLLVPILALGLIIWYVCKRAILVKYSIKIPADETLNQSLINIIPFIILIHALFSLWSHTASGLFQSNSPLIRLSWTIFYSGFDRIFNDIIILGQAAFIVLAIVIDFTIINFFGSLAECCKDQLQMPVVFAAIENKQYSQRLSKSNILGSYKLTNNPQYGHALKAYNQLIFRQNQGNQEESRNQFNTQQFT